MRQRVNMVEAVNLKKYAAKRYSLKFSLYFIFKYNTQSKDRKKKEKEKKTTKVMKNFFYAKLQIWLVETKQAIFLPNKNKETRLRKK